MPLAYPILPSREMQSTDQGICNSSVGLTFVGKVLRDQGGKTQDKIWVCRHVSLVLPTIKQLLLQTEMRSRSLSASGKLGSVTLQSCI